MDNDKAYLRKVKKGTQQFDEFVFGRLPEASDFPLMHNEDFHVLKLRMNWRGNNNVYYLSVNDVKFFMSNHKREKAHRVISEYSRINFIFDVNFHDYKGYPQFSKEEQFLRFAIMGLNIKNIDMYDPVEHIDVLSLQFYKKYSHLTNLDPFYAIRFSQAFDRFIENNKDSLSELVPSIL